MDEEMMIAAVKKYLERGQRILDEIAVGQDEILRLRDMAEKCTATYERSSGSSKQYNDRIADIVSQITDLEEELKNEILLYAKTYRKVKLFIRQIDDDTCRVILERKYLLNMTWKGIAAELGYAEQHIHRLHRKGLLLAYDILIEDVIEC